jgi:hypothetical protein
MNINRPTDFNKVSREEFDRVIANNSHLTMRREGWANCIRYVAEDRGDWTPCAYLMDNGECYLHPFLKTE